MLTATGRVAKATTRHYTNKDGEAGSAGVVVLVGLDDPTQYVKFDCRTDDLPEVGEVVTVGLYARAVQGTQGRPAWISYWATSVQAFASV